MPNEVTQKVGSTDLVVDTAPITSRVEKKPRRWRFTLRTLLVVATCTAALLAWYRHRVGQYREAVAAILNQEGSSVGYDYEMRLKLAPSQVSSAQWLTYQLGLESPSYVSLRGPEINDEFLRRHVLPLRSLESLDMREVLVTDTGLVRLMPLRNLKYLTCFRRGDFQRVAQQLDQSAMLDFEHVPLADALMYLEDFHQVTFQIDAQDLPDRVIDGLTARISNVDLATALTQLLEPHGLGWVLADDSIVVCTRDTAHARREGERAVRAALPHVKQILIDYDGTIPGLMSPRDLATPH